VPLTPSLSMNRPSHGLPATLSPSEGARDAVRARRAQSPVRSLPILWERFLRDDSRVEPQNRSRRPEPALIPCLEKQTSAPTNVGGYERFYFTQP